MLEFEILAEVENVLSLKSISIGGIFLRLEKRSPEMGCMSEWEKRHETWVRIVGLPVSLWDQTILRRIWEECGGFLAVDSQTEKLEELQWAQILVKMNGDELPNVVEIWIEDFCYALTLWWEVRSVLKVGSAGLRGVKTAAVGEVGGEAHACASKHVMEEGGVTRLEALPQLVDGTRGYTCRSGQLVELRLGGQNVTGPT